MTKRTVERVLVTGGAGFVGSHTTAALLDRGYDVTVLDLQTPPIRAWGRSAGVGGRLRTVRGDLLDLDILRAALGEADAVIHLAGYQDHVEDFDQFFASQVPYVQAANVTQVMNRDALVALLDKIGPAIVMTHSQSGAYGWPVADARPDLVKAVIAVEPSGPSPGSVGDRTMPAPEGNQHAKFKRLVEQAQTHSPATTAIAHPCDKVSLESAVEARKMKLIEPILVGNRGKIAQAAGDAGIDLGDIEIVDAEHSVDAAR
jgi:pimeloyl-ACP methyl ester carboxylesterase